MFRKRLFKISLVFGTLVAFFLTVTVGVYAAGKTEEKTKEKKVTAPAPEKNGLSQDLMKQLEKQGKVLNIYDWADWWPGEIYSGFSKEYGIKIVRDNYASTDEMITKFKLNPNASYDITIAETRAIIMLKKLGVLQKLNHSWIPNAEKYLPELTKNAWFDPGYHYSIATDLYFLGYCYNTKYVKKNDPRIGSWKMLFEGAKDYSGKVTLLDSMYSVIGCALKSLGYSYNSDNEQELKEAENLLLKIKPYISTFDDWPKRLVIEENAWMSQVWVGDAWLIHQDNPAIEAVLPKEGTLMGVDVLVIPKGSKHTAAAHLFMNYILRPDINALLIKTIGYAPNHTVSGSLLPEDMQKWPGVRVSKEYLKKCEYISPKSYTGKGLELRTKIWEKLKR